VIYVKLQELVIPVGKMNITEFVNNLFTLCCDSLSISNYDKYESNYK